MRPSAYRTPPTWLQFLLVLHHIFTFVPINIHTIFLVAYLQSNPCIQHCAVRSEIVSSLHQLGASLVSLVWQCNPQCPEHEHSRPLKLQADGAGFLGKILIIEDRA